MNDEVEVPQTSAAPLTAGARLRHAREAAGLSIADIAARTRISQRQVEHVEQGDYSAFASRTYAIGFARNIARTLGLDAEDVVRQVRSEIGAVQAYARPDDAFEPGDPARVPSRMLVWLSLAAAGLLLAGLFMAYRTYFSPAAELPSLVEQQEAEAAAAAAQAQAAASPAASAAAAASGPVVFTALGDGVWVRFYDAAGLRLLEKEMARGETFTVPADADGPMIRTARPDLLAITVGGRPVAPLATEMVTLRDVKVDAASLAARAPVAGASPAATPTSGAVRNPLAPVRTTPISEGARLPRAPAARAPAATPTVRRTTAAASTPAPAAQDSASANAASAAAAQDEAGAAPASQPAAEPAPAAE